MHQKKRRFKKFGEKKSTLGRFTNFPSTIHGRVKISHKSSINRLQLIIVKALRDLNGERFSRTLSVASKSREREGIVGFEVGVADGLHFYYLDEETLERVIKSLNSRKTFKVLDVIIIISYHYFESDKKIPLYFDHHLLRFTFERGELNLYLYHVKGIRRIPLEELLNQIIEKIKGRMKRSRSKYFKVEYFKTL